MKKDKTILNTPQVTIIQNEKEIVLRLKMESGQIVRCKPYSNDRKGLIGALTLAIDAIAGKVWLECLELSPTDKIKALPGYKESNEISSEDLEASAEFLDRKGEENAE